MGIATKNGGEAGQSLIEVLVAIGVFVAGIATVGLLVLDANVASRQGVERTQAILLAREGLEAVRSMRDGDFDNITAGAHGIALSGNKWIFSGTSDTQDQFTRVITVTDIDIDTKKIQSTVTWQFTQVRPNSVAFLDYLTDWNQTHGNAGDMIVDITSVGLNPPDNNQLRDIKIENVGSSTITIDKMTAWWNGTVKLKQIRIENTNVYGPVSDSAAVPSGTEVDIDNFSMTSGSGVKSVNQLRFTGDVSGTDFIIKFVMFDGSTNYVLIDL